MAEGVELLRTALDAGARLESLYVDAGSSADPEVAALAAGALAAGARVFDLAPGVVERVADTVTPQPVLAVAPMLDVPLDAVDLASGLVLVLADVRDPGNAGTILRSADASGVDAVVFSGGTVDPYNPKTVRSSAGSLFHIPVVVEGSAAGVLDELGRRGLRRLGAEARSAEDYATLDWGRPTALVLGNEASGVPPELAGHLDGTIGIPMPGRAESLNVGVAAAVLCFEALRQRRLAATVAGPGEPGRTMPAMRGGSGGGAR
ncbi:MAG TPA: RNA methyltransferase [Acidimicrobiales bacterium]|nr:RNA methyltransferase [Acidimicrobiales bacterium]